MKRIAGMFLGLVVLTGYALGQASDSALKDRVATLLERLDAPKPETQKSAEEALIKLGAKALPYLPDVDKLQGEKKARLERIREALRAATEDINIGASLITLKVKGIRLTEAVQKLQAMSGNPITDLREAEGGEASNPSLDLDIDNKPFLEALDILCRQAEITPNFFTGDGTIGLMPGKPPEKGLITYSGPFRITFKQLGISRDLQTDTSSASAALDVAWEPRLRPMLMKLDAKELKIVDDRGKPVEAQVMQEDMEVVLRPENPVAEMNLTLKAPERDAKKLGSMKVKVEFEIPAGLKTFRFANLAVKQAETVKQGDIGVTLEGAEIDEQVWKVNVQLSYPGGAPAAESYRQGLFNNRLWLQKADGSRFEHNGGFSDTGASDGKFGFEYLFVDAPGKPSDYGLVYETPSQVKKIPLEFEFKDVPLP
jgi:hypothetical protein